MSEHAAPAVAAEPGLMQKHHFLLRRLHSLSGILPVGLFVCMHLFTNAQMIHGQHDDPLHGGPGMSDFQHEVDFIHATPALQIVEIGLWLSIGFHAVLGVMYMTGVAYNTTNYKYRDNVRYHLQRITAWMALVFIFLHIATLRWRWNIFNWDTPFYSRWPVGDEEVPMSLPLTAYALQFHWAIVVFYFLFVLAVVYHWANGLWTAAITWGVTVTEAAMKRWGYICCALGIALTLAMSAAIVGALKYDLVDDTTENQKLALDAIVPDWRVEYGLSPSGASLDADDDGPGDHADHDDDGDEHDIHDDEDSGH